MIFDRIILNDDVTYQSSQFAYHSYFALFYARHTEGTLYIVNNRKGQKFYGIGVATVSIVEQQNSCLTHTSLFRSGYNTRRESQRDKEKDDLNTLLGTLSGTSGTSASTSASGIMRASSIRSSVSTRASTRASTRRMSLDLDTTKSDEFELTQAEELE